MAESYLAVSTAAFKHHPHADITHPDFGAVSGEDCTAALNAATAAAGANGSRRVFVPGGTYYTTGWAIPHNVAVYGAAQRASNIKALVEGQPYVIRYGSNTELHDLNILGDMLANTCVLSETGLTGKARFVRVRVAEGVQGGFIFDRHQNAKLYDCYAHYNGIGCGFINGAANVQLFGCDSDGDTSSSHGAFAGNVFDNPAWSNSAVFDGGGRNIRWFGGILERGAADAQLKVTRGNITLFGVELQGGSEATVIADGSDGGWANVSLNDCSHAIQSAAAVAAIARNQGRVFVQGEGGHNSGGPSTRGHQYVARGGYIGGDGGQAMRNGGHPLGGRFEVGGGAIQPSGGGVITFDETKNEYVISSSSAKAGGYLYWGVNPGPDNKRLLIVKLYISSITGGNARIYTTLPGSPWRRVQKQALGPGLHESVIHLQGDETGVQIAPDQAAATEIRVAFVDLAVR